MGIHTLSLEEQLKAKLRDIDKEKINGKSGTFDNRDSQVQKQETIGAGSFIWPNKFSEEERQLIGVEICDAREREGMS